MLSVELGSSRRAWLLLVAYVTLALVFGAIGAVRHDWVATVICLVASVGAIRMTVLLGRRAVRRTRSISVGTGRAAARAANGALFVSLGHQLAGKRLRDGVVLLGPSRAAFVALGGWSHWAWRLATFPTRFRFRFVDLAIDISNGGDIDAALEGAVAQYGGVIIGDDWTYAASQRWLLQPRAHNLVWLAQPPPESFTSRWRPVPPPSPERVRTIRNRIIAIAAGIASALTLGGLAGWRLTGDAELMLAGVIYAALVLTTVLGALLVAQRRVTAAHR